MTTTEFDTHVTTARAALDALVAQGAVEDANKKAYNLAADLAECWPGDDRPRTLAHLELGRALAEQCLAWRTELGKGARPFAIAHWVHGIHLMGIAQRTGDAALRAKAVAAFEESVAAAVAAAEEAGSPTARGASADYLVTLNTGFLGVALLNAAQAAFRSQVQSAPEKAEEARYGLENLAQAVRRFAV